ncbi:MAG: DUF6941 family protein [Chthoniobacterales bacterium]
MNAEPCLLPGVIFSESVIRDEETGKLSFLGVFHTFAFWQFPGTIGPFYVTVEVTNLRGLEAGMNVTCRFEMADNGQVIASQTGNMRFAPDNPLPLATNIVIDLPMSWQSLAFPNPGPYSVVILADGEEIGRRYFDVFVLQEVST